MAAPSKPGAGGKPAAKGPAWQGASGPRNQPRGPATTWRPTGPTPVDHEARHRFKRAAVGALLLVAVVVVVLLSLLRLEHTPLVVFRAGQYPLSMPPLAFAQEDADLLGKVSPTNIPVVGGKPAILSARESLKEFKEKLDEVGRSPPRLFGHNVILIYLAAHGVVNESDEPCLVPPQGDPLTSSTWLRLDDVLSELRTDSLKGRKKVVLLDCQRVPSCWRAGWLESRFAEVLPAAVERAQDDSLFVITAAGPGEVAWAAPEKRGSIFGHVVARVLRNGDVVLGGSIRFNKFFAAVSRDVDAYARSRHGLPQRPQLFHANSAGKLDAQETTRPTPGAAMAFGIAYAPWFGFFRGGAIEQLQSSNDPIAEGAKLWGASPAADGRASDRPDGSLRSVWRLYQQRRAPAADSGQLPAFVANPVVWASVQQRLTAIGERLFAGEEYQANLDRDIRLLESQLAEPGGEWSPAGAVAALNAPLTARGKQSGSGRNEFAEFLRRKQDPDKQPPEPIAASISEATVVRDIYAVLSEQTADARRKLEDAASVLAAGRADGRYANLIESHFLTLLDLGVPAGEGLSAEVLAAALNCRQAAEQAATPLDMRVHYALEQTVNETDEKRRQAEDALFLMANPEAVNRLMNDAIGRERGAAGYLAAKARGDELAKAYRLRDEVWSELPRMAEWHLRRASFGRSSPALDDLLQILEPEAGAQRGPAAGVFALDQALEQALVARDGQANLSTALDRLRQAYSNVEANWSRVVDELDRVYQSSMKITEFRTREDFREAELALGTLPPGASFDTLVPLYLESLRSKQQRAGDLSLDSSGLEQPPADKAPADKATADKATPAKARQLLREIHRALDYKFDKSEYFEHRSLAVWNESRPVDAVFEEQKRLIKGLLDDYNKFPDRLEWNAQRRALSAAEELRRWDRRVRVAIAFLPEHLVNAKYKTPARRLQEWDAKHLTAWQAFRALGDFWGNGRLPAESPASSAAPFFATVVERCRAVFRGSNDGMEILRYDLPGGGLADFSLADGPALAALLNWRGVTFKDAQAPSAGSAEPTKYVLAPQAATIQDGKELTIPQGEATLRLVGSDGQTAIPRAEFDGAVAATVRQPAGASQPLTATVPVSNPSGAPPPEVLARFWYRGHVRTVPSPNGPSRSAIQYTHKNPPYPAPTVRVNGEDTIRGTVLFVFDCSRSMRGGGFRDAKQELLSVLSDQRFAAKSLRVGLMAYGHRTDLDAAEAMFDRKRSSDDPRNRRIPNPFPHPDKDYEVIVPVAGGTALGVSDSMRKLDESRCVGGTPLYGAIVHAIDVLQNEPGPCQIVVISDGVNMPWNVGKRPPNPDYMWGPILDNGKEVSGQIEDKKPYEALGSALQRNAGRIAVTVHLFGALATPFEQAQDLRLKALMTEHNNFAVKRLLFANLIANSMWETFPTTDIRLQTTGRDGNGQQLTFGNESEISNWKADGQTHRHVLQVTSAGKSEIMARELDLIGGETVVLKYDATGLTPELTFEGDAFRPRNSAKALPRSPLPGGSGLRSVDAGDPEWLGVDITKLLFRIRSQDEQRNFTPRPKYVWLEITPNRSGADAAQNVLPMIDAVWKENINLPLLEVPVTEWPRESRTARVKFWFREAEFARRADAAVSASDAGQTIVRGSESWQIEQTGGGASELRRIKVTCKPSGAAATLSNLLARAVWLSPPPSQTHRSYQRDGSEATHTFTYEASDNATIQVRIVDREEFERDAYFAEFEYGVEK